MKNFENKTTSKNNVNWNSIDKLSHNREADGFTDEEKELTKSVDWQTIDQLEHNKEADNL